MVAGSCAFGIAHRKAHSVLSYFLPRAVHPGAWWLWAIGLAVVACRGPGLPTIVFLVAVLVVVVLFRRGATPWATSFRLYVWLAVVITAVRIVFQIVFPIGGSPVLFGLPALSLPGGMHLFGPVTPAGLLAGLRTGGQLAVIVLCVGAANSLSSPKHLLAAAPRALYEMGTVTVITVSVFPQLADSVRRVNRARSLRGGGRGHWLREVIMPVLADAIDRSLSLAGAMDSRGFGRRAIHTRYRRDPWRGAEWLVTAAGVAPAVCALWLGAWTLSVWLAAALLLAVCPAWLTPRQEVTR